MKYRKQIFHWIHPLILQWIEKIIPAFELRPVVLPIRRNRVVFFSSARFFGVTVSIGVIRIGAKNFHNKLANLFFSGERMLKS